MRINGLRRVGLFVIIFIYLLVLSAMSSEMVEAKTYREGKVYTVAGRLKTRTYQHGGNGLMVKGYMLELRKKIKVSSARYEMFSGKEVDINVNSLSKKNAAMLEKWIGKRVKVKGFFMIPDSIWWWYNRGIIVASKVKKR